MQLSVDILEMRSIAKMSCLVLLPCCCKYWWLQMTRF